MLSRQLGDGFALLLSTIGDEELGFALAPDFGGATHVCVQCSSDIHNTTSVWLCIAGTNMDQETLALV